MGGIVIAAPKSGSGKTMVTCGLLMLLGRKGWNPAAFKCGPDYIDGLFHRKVLGVESGNLDSFFETPEHMEAKKVQAEEEHFLVAEGVMGYFDGLGGVSVKGSSYEIANLLNLPVLLVVDAKGASVSLAAQIHGFLDYVPRDDDGAALTNGRPIAGVLFNRISPMMYAGMKRMIEEQLHVPVVGYVPELDFLQVGSRHLGLVLPDEIEGLKGQMEQLADCMEKTVDMDVLAEISGYGAGEDDRTLSPAGRREAENNGPDRAREKNSCNAHDGNPDSTRGKITHTIRGEAGLGKCGKFSLGIAMDEAFCFYYRDNLEALERAGAELVYFSPVHDSGLPPKLDGLLFGGGYPENYAGELSANQAMRCSVLEAARVGMPVLGECGGYLYLLESLEDARGNDYPMAGVLPGRGFRGGRKGRFGYIVLHPLRELPYASPGMEIKGHEFHYWDCECGEEEYGMKACKPIGDRSWSCMRTVGNVMAGFPHLYYPSCPELVRRFAERCIAFGKEAGV